jgi:hypothetical protein
MENRRPRRYDEHMRVFTLGARVAVVAGGVACGAVVALLTLSAF